MWRRVKADDNIISDILIPLFVWFVKQHIARPLLDGPALLGDDLGQDDPLEVGLQELGVPHVGHPEHEPQHAVGQGDDGTRGKQNSRGSTLRSGQFGKHDARHTSLE